MTSEWMATAAIAVLVSVVSLLWLKLLDLRAELREAERAGQKVVDERKHWKMIADGLTFQLHDLYKILAKDGESILDVSHDQFVGRANALCSGWYVKAVDHFTDQLWKVFGDSRKVKTWENMRDSLDEFVKLKESGLVFTASQDLKRIQGEYNELRDAINEVSPGDEYHDNHGMLLGRLKSFIIGSESEIKSLKAKIAILQAGSGSWRALRREIADCCGKTVPEDAEPPNHGECVAMLRELEKKAAKWDRLNGEGVQKIDLPTIPVRGQMLFWWPCGKALPMGMACACEKCRSESEKVDLRFKAHNGPDHSEPLAPVMGCGDVSKDDFHRAAASKFAAGCIDRKSIVFPFAVAGVDKASEKDFSVDYAAGPHRLIATADSIENAPAESAPADLPADFAIDRVLAHAEQRSNCYG